VRRERRTSFDGVRRKFLVRGVEEPESPPPTNCFSR